MAPRKPRQVKKKRPEVFNETELNSATTGSGIPTQRANIEDYLDEDVELASQKYFVLSYLLPNKKNELEVPMIKVRGSYRSVDDCNARIETLKPIDTYHNMYISEVGKWGGLFDEDTIKKMDNVDIQYREHQLNTMMHNYKEQKDKNDIEFEKRTKAMKDRAKYEGTKEGQEMLAAKRENPISVKSRLISVTNQLAELNERVAELEELKKRTQEAFDNLTKEEIQEIEDFERQCRSEAIRNMLVDGEAEASGISEIEPVKAVEELEVGQRV
jgi:hypothetical protein